MKRKAQKINKFMFALLIEKGMDKFSVVELRDGFLEIMVEKYSLDEARKYVYRQILAYEKKGWLTSEGQGRRKVYVKSDLFNSLEFIGVNTPKKASLVKKELSSIDNYTTLTREKSNSEGELAIVLGEVEEYQTLMSRFPALNTSLNILFEEAKDRSAKLLGRINALSKVIELSRSKDALC
ncbi:hypothetical protein [Paraglaciecola sp. 25GB23A]|uniref:hypothetical protein n=1 Tax=Paraglaciecola sp. 25GB23A TaxID=3156068 RepID=UPI0032AF63A4